MFRCRFIAAAVLTVAALVAPALAQTTPVQWKCTGEAGIPWEQQIAGCTAAIQSGQYAGKALSWAYANRGTAHQLTSQTDRAATDLDEAIRLDPDNAPAFNSRGIIAAMRKQTDRAIEDFNQAIKLKPNFAKPYFNRGRLLAETGQTDRAIADFTRVIALDPKNVMALRGRAGVYGRKNEHDKAIADFNRAITLDPNQPPLFTARGGDRLRKDVDVDLDLAIDVIHGPLFMRSMIRQLPITVDELETLIDYAVRALAPEPAPTAAPDGT